MPYATATNFLERFATEYLLRRAAAASSSDLRRPTDAERLALARQERFAIGVAALAGALAGAILAAVEIGLNRKLGTPLELDAWRDQLHEWSIFAAGILVVSVAEIACLYWNALAMTSRYASSTGLPRLLPDALEDLRARGLARAALELPDPREPVFGIDPYARVPAWRHWAGAILYRLKVGATNLMLRVLVRRVLGRAAVRLFVPLLAIPVFAVWNGLITWWALRQVRIRAFGALAVREQAARLREDAGALGGDARRVIVEAVGEALARNEGGHPNLVLLLSAVMSALDVQTDRLDGDWATCRTRCARLTARERHALIETLTLALVVDGRTTKAQQELLADAAAICELPVEPDRLARLRRAVADGTSVS